MSGFSENLLVETQFTIGIIDCECPICLSICDDPHMCKNGHNFCLSCISTSLESKRECPTCKTFLSQDKLSQNRILRLHIGCFRSKCPGHPGCSWINPLELFKTHCASCVHCEEVDCPFWSLGLGLCHQSCNGKLKKGGLDLHILSAPNLVNNITFLTSHFKIQSELATRLDEQLVRYRSLFDSYTRDGKVLPAGFRFHQYNTGDNYIGQMQEEGNVRHGQGMLHCASGDKYNGEWLFGVMSGVGVMHYANGEVYHGEWLANKRHGNGTWFAAPRLPMQEGQTRAESYSGEWIGGERQGQGVENCANGDVYSGGWHSNERQGFGRLECFVDNEE